MTFNNKQELINKIKEKEESAKIAYEQTFNAQPCYETKEKQVKNKAYMEAYADVMALIDSAKIVVYPEETGKAPTTRNDELDARQYAVEGLKQNLLKVYFGKKVCVHTKKRIMGSRTPFTTIGKVVVDSGKYVSIKEEDGRYSTIDKADIESIEIVSAPEHIEESKTLLDPLCNKCGKTKEECPFHRMGSAYEDCSGFKEQKPQEIRNDRFREFEFNYGIEKRTIDAKAIKSINIQKSFKLNTQYQVYVDSILMAEGEYEELIKIYNELVEWWKYWKQN